MDNKKNILYIGPYNEESNRGKIALTNIKGLQKIGHNLKIVPIYDNQEKYRNTLEDLSTLETNRLESYDVCIQHCDVMQYAFNGCVGKNIGIYNCKNIPSEPIINTRLALLDFIVVNSQTVYNGLRRVLSKNLSKNMVFCPTYIDLEYIKNYSKDKMEWANDTKYYFYTELEFDDNYDWEKIIYVYMTTFKHKNCELIIKTANIADGDEASIISEKINLIAASANLTLNDQNRPKILNGTFDENIMMQIYNTINCFIDCGKTHEYNTNIFIAAALQKDIICNAKLASGEFFPEAYQVDADPCNIKNKRYNDIMSSSMYDTSYSMKCESLREAMITIYHNQYTVKKIDEETLKLYDISNINNLLC